MNSLQEILARLRRLDRRRRTRLADLLRYACDDRERLQDDPADSIPVVLPWEYEPTGAGDYREVRITFDEVTRDVDDTNSVLAAVAAVIERFSPENSAVINVVQGFGEFFEVRTDLAARSNGVAVGGTPSARISLVERAYITSNVIVTLARRFLDRSNGWSPPGCILVHLDELPDAVSVEFDARAFSRSYAESLATSLADELGRARSHPVPDALNPILGWEVGPVQDELPANVPGWLLAAGKLFSYKCALSCTGRSLTYHEVFQSVLRAAGALREKAVKPGDRVVIYSNRSIDSIILVLAVILAGGVYVPVERSRPSIYLNEIILDAGAHVVVTEDPADTRAPSGVTVLGLDELLAAPAAHALDEEELQRGGNDHGKDIYVLYTSGSTGRPKGVVVQQEALLAFVSALAEDYEITPMDTVLQFASLMFDVSVFEIFATLATGAKLRLVSDEEKKRPSVVSDIIHEDGITVAEIPPTYLPLLDPSKCGSLRLISLGGEPFGKAAFEAFCRPGRRIVNGYGPTESTVAVALFDCAGLVFARPPIGRPIPNVQLRVLNWKKGRCGIGQVGELHVSGKTLARGYTDPTETRERFIHLATDDARTQRAFCTGDLVRWRGDGNLEFLGRKDALLKVKGYRIEPTEVEKVLGKMESVQRCHVCVEGARDCAYLSAYVVSDASFTPAEARSFLSARLPWYMVPSAYKRVTEIPLTGRGKVDWKRLRVQSEAAEPENEPSPSGNGIEARIRDVIARAIHTKLPLDANLVDEGANSLELTAIIAAIDRYFGIRLSAVDVYRNPTVGNITRLVQQARLGGARPITIRDCSNLEAPWVRPVRTSPLNRKSIVFFYGAGGSLFEVNAWIEHFRADFDIFCVSLPGRDEDARGQLEPSMDRLSSYVLDCIHTAFEGTGPLPFATSPERDVTFVGHSMGALLAYDVARKLIGTGRHPVSLIANCARAPNANWKTYFTRQGDARPYRVALAERLGIEPKNPEVVDRLWSDSVASETYHAAASSGNRLRCPIHCIVGRDDPFLEEEDALKWRQFTSGPFSVHTVEGGHTPMSTAAETTFTILNGLLES